MDIITTIEYDMPYGNVVINGEKIPAPSISFEEKEENKVLSLTIKADGKEFVLSAKRSFFNGYGDVDDKISEFKKTLPALIASYNHVIEMQKIVDGEIPHIETPSGILLKKGEFAVMHSADVKYCQEKVKTEIYGGGGSIRVAKGVTLRGGKGVPVKTEYIATLDTGDLTLTNKRLIFEGKAKTTTIPLSKISHVEPYRDGIAVSKETAQAKPMFVNIDGQKYAILIEKLFAELE